MGAIIAGAGVAAAWLLLWGLLAGSARSFSWFTLAASAVAWLAAILLARFGDRGVAVGVGLAACVGWTTVGVLVVVRWSTSGWPLW